ncbi:hypothetical protein ALC62_15127 [Cyphomyrmex costatus]|uniref:Uncharacterized protein n=1 Tax=Cyphomyrmex costatus TaxID=456900 RepID=A0A151I807_9HYME|nr:hypothetical protein ALC62_15127 [Cyphomyrmex costatus]
MDSGTNWELACNKSIHPLARTLAAHAANRPEQRALARDVPVVCVAPPSLAVTLAIKVFLWGATAAMTPTMTTTTTMMMMMMTMMTTKR